MTKSKAMPMSDAEKSEALAMLRAGKTAYEVVDWIGCSYRQVVDLADAHGVTRPVRIDPRGVKVMKMLENGVSRREIASTLHMTRDQISGVVHRTRKATEAAQ